MTSNVGAELIKKQNTMGFGALGGSAEGDANYEVMKEKLTEQAKKVFKPEFLNRLDDLIVFHMLEKPDLERIVDLEVSKVTARVKTKGIALDLTAEAREVIIEQGYDPSYGARPMRRAVERLMEDPLAEHLLRGDIHDGDTVEIRRDESGKSLTFHVKSPQGPAPANQG
jgi:ATP-dependent Clp protease ATP-binding subunit ClpC